MKRSWTAIAVAFAAFFAATGCNDYGNTFQSNTGAFLQFVSPSNATAGGSGYNYHDGQRFRNANHRYLESNKTHNMRRDDYRGERMRPGE